jgi:hypothetical protein
VFYSEKPIREKTTLVGVNNKNKKKVINSDGLNLLNVTEKKLLEACLLETLPQRLAVNDSFPYFRCDFQKGLFPVSIFHLSTEEVSLGVQIVITFDP